MKNYRTIIVVHPDIYDKIELYRQFLEKSEFKSSLDCAFFAEINSVEELSSTELEKVEDFVYLFGKINREEYKKHYAEIEEKRKKYQNASHYMLFCQNKFEEEAYGDSQKNDAHVHKTFSIGILDEEIPNSDTLGDRLKYLETERDCIKLLVLAMAISKFNEEESKAYFESNYMCVNITLDYNNIYYAIMHSLCDEADLINDKEREVKLNCMNIDNLKTMNSRICEGIFGDDEIDLTKTSLKPSISSYKNTKELQREMEFAYKNGRDSLEKSIKQKIHIARCALALEESHKSEIKIEIENGHIQTEETDTSNQYQAYMTVHEAKTEEEEQKVARPPELLQKCVGDSGIHPVKFRALMPLAREFDKNGKIKTLPMIIAAFVFALAFFAVHGIIYYVRYYKGGSTGLVLRDYVTVLGIPTIAMILTGIVGIIVGLVLYLYKKSVFKKTYTELKQFLESRVTIRDKIKEYINKYLTVYYNYHIKYARISELEEQNALLEYEIETIRKSIYPLNEEADNICLLNGSRVEIPKLTPDDGETKDSLSLKKYIGSIVKIETTVTCGDKSIKTVSPWAKKISYSIGNPNSGGGK